MFFLEWNWIGIVFKDTHLSMLIAHKLKIEAVQRRTSNDIQISHKIHPNGHEPKNNKNNNIKFQHKHWIGFCSNENIIKIIMIIISSPTINTNTAGGKTKIPTSQSATARLITKQLVTVRNLLVVITDAITNVLPMIVTAISKQNKIIQMIFFHDNCQFSNEKSTVVLFIVVRGVWKLKFTFILYLTLKSLRITSVQFIIIKMDESFGRVLVVMNSLIVSLWSFIVVALLFFLFPLSTF